MFDGWPSVLSRLTRGESLDGNEARAALEDILSGNVAPTVIAAFLVALRTKGETSTELGGLVEAMLAAAERVSLPEDVVVIDTCGTGGDRSGSINISTAGALVVAGAGIRVCKHGNRASSSSTGSADVLEALGVTVDAPPETVARCVEVANIGFCFAPRFHPAMRHVGPTRKELGIPTVFNFLGPLVNPGGVRRQVIGVSDKRMAQLMIDVLRARGAVHAMVVYGHDGLDELTTTGPSTVLELREGAIAEYSLDPTDLGFEVATLDQLRGGDASTNAGYVRRVLEGEKGPHRDVVVLNASAGMVISGVAKDFEEGRPLAERSIDSGSAMTALTRLVEESST